MGIASSAHPRGRLLLGAGPSNMEERVLRALTNPVVGNCDPALLPVMAELQRLLRLVMGTRGATFPLAGTGSAAVEAALLNLIEPGDRVAVGVAGFFGERVREMAALCGARVVVLPAAWGQCIEPEQVAAAFRRYPDIRAVAVVQGETSTGVLQPLSDISQLVRAHDALLIVDAVSTSGAHPVDMDAHAIDVCCAGSQKALSAPAGLAPVACSPRALARMRGRKLPVPSVYFNLQVLADYWGTPDFCHHTPPVSLYYALREALRAAAEEGLPQRFARHRRTHLALVAGLEAMGLTMQVAAPADRLWSVNTVRIPEGVDDRKVRHHVLAEFGIEISGGLGELAGQVWRVGVMGTNAWLANALRVLAALEEALRAQGVRCGSGLAAAQSVFDTEQLVAEGNALLTA
ncbi:MAG TPA: alanine--glyoxylate aminotransferase family protein [Candidatus Sulfotelmatobacter sp.]|nr:alanine--glyoxylate aminotransferase family protein [Candidatus Sulfotelmatobacter sp.]